MAENSSVFTQIQEDFAQIIKFYMCKTYLKYRWAEVFKGASLSGSYGYYVRTIYSHQNVIR